MMDTRETGLRLLCIITFLIVALSAQGQVKDWGDISEKNLNMDAHPLDSSAAAVVLFEKGNLRVEDNLSYFLDKHVRIKILREEGYKWGNVKIDYNTDYGQEVGDIEAVTYNLAPDGSIQKQKLDSDAIYDKEIINDWNQKSFTLPSLKPGSIIEYKYTLKIGDPSYIPAWYFNKTIPVKWNQLTAEFPSFLNFSKVYSGNEELDVNKFDEFNKAISISFKNNNRDLFSAANNYKSESRINFNGERFTWAMEDQEAIQDLPFMTSVDDYKARINFQLAELKIPGEIQHDFAKNWGKVVDRLMQGNFGAYLNQYISNYEKFATPLSRTSSDPVEEVKEIFQRVTYSYSWNGNYGIIPQKKLQQVIQTNKGSGVELNLLLTRLLREARIEAYPVLISTRDHGSVSKKYVLPNQFNHVIVLVRLDEQEFLLDTVTGNRPIYNLPENDLNDEGLIVKRPYKKKKRWINIVPLQETVRVGKLYANIKSDGTLAGRTTFQSTGYMGFEDRTKVLENGINNFVSENVFRAFSNSNIIRASYNTLADLDSVFTYKVYFDSARSAATQATDSLIYVDSTPFMKWKESPLQQPERKYPVNFPYKSEQQFVAVYTIPEGYKIESHPEDITTRIARKGGFFKRTTKVQGKQIMMQWRVKFGRTLYEPKEYDRLKMFFDQVIEAHSEKIVLKKVKG